jgi:hypothetical protein
VLARKVRHDLCLQKENLVGIVKTTARALYVSDIIYLLPTSVPTERQGCLLKNIAGKKLVTLCLVFFR